METIREQLESYIKDLEWDKQETNKRYDKLLSLIDNEEDQSKKRDYLSELANTAGKYDTLKNTIECLKDIIKQ